MRINSGHGSSSTSPDARHPVRRKPRSAPLTPTQRDLYLHHVQHPASTQHLIGDSCRLDADLRTDLWLQAVDTVLSQEPLTRTRLVVVDGEVCQQVDESAATPVCRVVDLTTEPSDVASAEDSIERDRQQPFDLLRLPLWRGTLVRDRDGTWVAALLAPHIVADGWGHKLLLERIGREYERLCRGGTGAVESPPAMSFLDYAAGAVPEFDTAEIQRFWSETLARVEPFALAGSCRGTGRGREELSIAAAEVNEIRKFCGGRGWPFVTFLRAVYALLIRRFTASTGDLALLDVLDARPPGFRRTIGCFFQTLPILVAAERSRGDASIEDLIAAMAAHRRHAEPCRNISMLALGRLLPPESLKCFFNFYLFESVDLLGRRRQLHTYDGYGDDEMHLAPSLTPDGLRLTLDFPADRFPGLRFLPRFVQLIRQVMAGASRLDELDLLLPGEATTVEPVTADAGPREPVDHLSAIAAHGARHADTIAVSCAGSRISYGDLDARSNRLAHHLLERGAGRGVVVAIALDRSPELIVTILAVLKTGAAYLPLDPANPRARLALMLRDSRAPLLVTTRALAGARSAGDGCSVVCVDDERKAINAQPALAPELDLDPEDAAYVIYTSGSTGTPKGVVVTHGNLTALLDAAAQTFRFSDRDVWTMFHSAAFDFSVWEIFGALTFGGRLVVAPHATTRSPEAFYQLLHDERITVLSQTPSAFSTLSEWEAHMSSPLPLSLRYVVFGGEALRPEALSSWIDRHGDADPMLVNMFGITETTVHVTFRRMTRRDGERARGRSPIGRPLPGWIVTLRDPDGHPVPPGLAGEIYVGGVGVARGYLRRPELDAERFVTLADRPRERFYRSGDLARVLPDGELDYLGRADSQLKIRGFRIEPGEVEAALLAEAGIHQAAVVAVEHAGERRLVAYVVAAPGASPVEADLRRRLAARLPEHMVPARILTLAELPRTPNGKLDRRALPAPGDERPGGEGELVPPSTPVEAEIALIWSEVLGVGRIGAADQFFELGGNSLSAVQMMLRVQDRFGVSLPLCTAFQCATVASLADAVERSGGSIAAARGRAAYESPPARSEGPAPLTLAQERAWFVQQLHPESVAYHFVATLTLHGEVDVDALARALAELVCRHEVLRTTFASVDGSPRQRVHAAWPVELSAEDASAAEAEAWIRTESERPFDLDTLPLVRWRLFRLEPRRHLLVHIEHHLLHDGWSFALLLRELLILYDAFASGEPSPLPPARWHPSDVALLERQWIETDAAQRQLAFWTRTLTGVPKVLELPADRPRPAVERFRGDAVRIRLDDELCARIEAFSRRRRVTPHMALRAIFEALVHRLTGLERFVVGCGVANRHTPALESVVGMVLNNVALPADLSGAPDLETLLSRVRDTAVAALDHQGVPFDRVVAAVDPERSPDRSPLCQVFFSSYDGPLPELQRRDVRVEPCFGLNNGSAKFDLNVIVAAVPTTPPGGPAGASTSRPSRSIEMIWEYSTDLFERETIERWTAWFVTLLDAALEEPSRPIHALPLMSPAEREQVLVAWNRTATEFPRDAALHELFEGVAQRTPEHPALVAGDRVITYRELDRRADEFAAYLAEHGVGAGARVGLCLERSPDTIAAILGTLKAGAAYVPLDPSDPPDRHALLVREASLDLVHGETGCEALPDGPGPTPRFPDAAYVMFTSGSTGPPKGVVVTHRNVVRLVRGTDYATLRPGEVLLQMAPLTFDASTFEIWGALSNGATLVLWPDREIDLGALRRVVEQHHVTTLWLTASLLHAVVRTSLQALAGLRQLLAGGDVLQPDDVARVRRAYPDLRIVNGYGPTEATTFSCCYVVPPGPVSEGSIPIGRPISNTTAYVLDDRLEPAPIGVPGELFIGGDGVAHGYVNAPDLTAQRFLPDPWSDRGGRLYRTGDRVRWRADGQLEFLGRIDRQVKVRGYRVEPAELETVIASLPDIRQVAVTTPEDPACGRRLHAFVVADGEVLGAALRAALASRLPGYMIPSGFTFLDHLPMTSGGKIDYASLPPPEAAREGTRAVTMPRNETERVLVEVCESVLGRGGIGTGDAFFDLGGHSLLAMQVAARIEERLGVRLPLRAVFEASTLAELAAAIDRSAEADRAAGPPIARQPRRAAAASPRRAGES